MAIFIVNAQNVAPFWSTTANNNTSATSRLGTSNWNPLRFFTNNVERMRVNNGGNIGIGTTTPLQKLDVVGNVNISSAFALYMGNQKLLRAPGDFNLYLGYHAGENSGDVENLFIGEFCGQNNTAGHNLFVGQLTGINNSGYFNTFFGHGIAQNNVGSSNAFFGDDAGKSNVSGEENHAFGQSALYSNKDGDQNSAFGQSAGSQTKQRENSFFGAGAGSFNVSGFNNTYVGAHSNPTAVNYSNSSSLGHSTAITASNQVRLGNSSVTSIGGYADWTNISDGRLKANVKYNSVPGLEFINLLQPATYNLKMDEVVAQQNEFAAASMITAASHGKKKGSSTEVSNALKEKEQIVYTGFVAQDVEKAAKQLGFDFSGVDAPKNDKDYYGLRYASFVVPLVKAVQELDSANKAKDEKIAMLEEKLNRILEHLGEDRISSAGWMKQNTPNPVRSSTAIEYYIPEDAKYAQIVFMNAKRQQLKSYNVRGSGKVNFATANLPSGTYTYTLVTDGKTIVTKKMVIAR